MSYAAILDGLPYDDVEMAEAALVQRSSTRREQAAAAMVSMHVAAARGRLESASIPPSAVVLLAIFNDGLDGQVENIVARARGRLGYADACNLALWRVSRGDTSGTRSAITRLHATAADGGDVPVCPTLLEAWLEVHGAPSAGAPALVRVETMLRNGPRTHFADYAYFIVAQLHARRGDAVAALAAVRRRLYQISTPQILLVPGYKRLEGRYAALAGDTAAAIRAYRHYLTLRTAPDPSLQPEVQAVRVALEELLVPGG